MDFILKNADAVRPDSNLKLILGMGALLVLGKGFGLPTLFWIPVLFFLQYGFRHFLLWTAKKIESYEYRQKRHARIDAEYFLIDNPEHTKRELLSKFPNLDEPEVIAVASRAFKEQIRQNSFENAKKLIDYYPVDEHGLLPVAVALDSYKQTGALNLKPQTYKITLDPTETAYEKLPCNWQKIHTYLAPLTDELEQSDILDTGNIYITDQRVFFVGKKGSETVSLSDIAYMDLKDDALQFFRDEGLSEIFAFPTAHHAKYAELVIQELMGR